jgi:hypothetical protein
LFKYNCKINEDVVADAVQVEPVSTAKFPANREKNREFYIIAISVGSETANNGVTTGLPKRIPYSTEQGILTREQGILSAEFKSSPNEIFVTKDIWVMSALTPPKADIDR